MDEYLRKLATGPLADPLKLNLPQGKLPAKRAPKEQREPMPGDLTTRQVRERHKRQAEAKLASLFDYYAGTDLTPEAVARHMGLYIKQQCGVDEETGKPIYESILDVGRAAEQLKWRRDKRG